MFYLFAYRNLHVENRTIKNIRIKFFEVIDYYRCRKASEQKTEELKDLLLSKLATIEN